MSVNLYFSQFQSPEIPFTMNKSLHQPKRIFGQNLKNNFSENDIEAKLALKSRTRKSPEFAAEDTVSCHPEMKYSDQILKYVLTTITYPNVLRSRQKVTRDIEMLIFQVTSTKIHNNVWNGKSAIENQKIQTYFPSKTLTIEKRNTLIEWLITVHRKYKLRESTLHLAVALIDGHCESTNVPISRYQLLGVSALFMAAKYEEIQLPRFQDYYELIEKQYQPREIKEMEAQILETTQFNLSKKVTLLWYLQALATEQSIFSKDYKYTKKAIKAERENKENLRAILPSEEENKFDKFMELCRYILNLILLDYPLLAKYKQDILAISTIIFVSLKREFIECDSKEMLDSFVKRKFQYLEGNSNEKEMNRQIKRCMQKIEKLYAQRFQNKFHCLEGKFNVDVKH